MRILVDADACPVKDVIVSVGNNRGIPVLLVASPNHRMTSEEGVRVITTDSGPQAVDMVIVNMVDSDDIVVTQDFGLAALILGKKARAVSPRGMQYTNENIDMLLFQRDFSARIRRGGGRTKGPPAFGTEDRERFKHTLERMIEKGDSLKSNT